MASDLRVHQGCNGLTRVIAIPGAPTPVNEMSVQAADHVAGVLRIRRPYTPTYLRLRRLGVMAVAAPVLEQLTLAVAGFVVFVSGMIAVAAHHETATLSSHCCRNKSPRVKFGGFFVGGPSGAWPLPPAKAISRP